MPQSLLAGYSWPRASASMPLPAQTCLIGVGKALNHLPARETLDEVGARMLAERGAACGVAYKLPDGAGQRLRVAGGHEQPGHPVRHDLRDAAGVRRDNGAGQRGGMQHSGRQRVRLGWRMDEDAERADEGQRILTPAGESDSAAEAVPGDTPMQIGLERAL